MDLQDFLRNFKQDVSNGVRRIEMRRKIDGKV